MSPIDDWMAERCPHGVEYVPLGDLVVIKNGRDYKHLGSGDVPVYGSGGVMTYVDTPAHLGPSVLIPRKGSLNNIFYIDEPFWTVDTIFYTEIGDRIEGEYLYHFLLKSRLGEMNQAGGVPSQTQTALKKIRVPLPPPHVQQEIVRILGQFTRLAAELEAELEARRRQYVHYRGELLLAGEDVMMRPLGALAKNLDRQRRPVTKSSRVGGEIPYYGASGVVDYVRDYIFDGDFLLISEDGANLLARSTPIAFSVSGKSWINNHAHVLDFDSHAERRFVEFYLNSIDLTSYISGGAQPKLNQANLNRIPIPDLPLNEKERIVKALDSFDALINDPNVGLRAELAARQMQYEYYRDRLLTFEEATA